MTDVTIALSDLEWTSGQGVHTVGKAFLDNELLETADLHRSFRGASSYDAFRELVADLNGQFAVIIEQDNRLWAAVDHIRTHPVYYTVFDDRIFIGDDYPAIDDTIEHKSPDRVSAMEFIVAGYPSGPHTLHPDINKMRAGEILSIDTSRSSPEVDTDEYFQYPQASDPIYDKNELFNRIDTALINAFERTIEVADDRPIILPLSGGYDSRLIALMLHRMERQNVHTFCHDRQESEDMRLSKKIADDLGYKWEPLTFSDEELEEAKKSSKYEEIYSSIGNFGTLQPNPMTIKISEHYNSVVEDKNPVYLIGHTAAAPGGFMPSFFDKISKATKTTVLHTIFDYHYNKGIWDRNKYGDDFEARIFNELPYQNYSETDSAISAIEYWYWRERIPNRLLTPPLVRHYLNETRWYPLWDKEFTKIFLHFPSKYRLNKKTYHEYIKHQYHAIQEKWYPTDKELQNLTLPDKIQSFIGPYLIGTSLEPMSRKLNYEKNVMMSSKGEYDLDEIIEMNISPNKLSHPFSCEAYKRIISAQNCHSPR